MRRLRHIERRLAALKTKLDSRAVCGSFEVNINSDLSVLAGKCGVLIVNGKDDAEWDLIVSKLPPWEPGQECGLLIVPRQETMDEWIARHGQTDAGFGREWPLRENRV
jgi:hypothetical protein